MTTKSKPKKKTKSHRGRKASGGNFLAGFQAFVDLISIVIDRFGWPGAVMILGFYFVERHASLEQKQNLIDRYLLRDGVYESYQIVIVVVFFIIIFYAQKRYYMKKIGTMQSEVDRLADWKSARQQEKIGTNLHHS